MWSVRYQAPVGGKDRAREVIPLLDVHRVRGVGQGGAHLLGNAHEQVVEHLEHYWIGIGAHRFARRTGDDPAQDTVATFGDLGLPPRLDHDRADLLGDDRRPEDWLSGTQLVAPEHRRLLHLTTGVDADHIDRSRIGVCDGGRPRAVVVLFLAASNPFHRHTLDHQISAWSDVTEPLLMHALEALDHG